MGRKKTSARRRPDLLWAAGLTLLAWLHRLAFLFSNRDRAWPYTIFYEGDSRTFFHYARALLEGKLYDSGIPFHPPGFPAFLAAVHTLLGAGSGAAEIPHLGVKAVLALVSSLSVGLLFLLVRPYLGPVVALVASLLCVWHFGLYVIAVAPVTEGLYLTLLLAALLLWSRKLEHPLSAPGSEASAKPWRAGLAFGLALGILALVRAESVLIAVLLVAVGLLAAVFRKERTAAAFLPWILVAGGWIVGVAPWTARNAVRLTQYNEAQVGRLAEPVPTFVPLTIYGPVNLALANRPGADGTFSATPVTGSGSLDFTNARQLAFVLHGDERAWEWIRAHPADFARLVVRKWGLYFEAFKLGFTQWNWPGGLAGARRPVDVFVPDSSPTGWLLPLFVLAGLLVCLASPGGPRRWALLVVLLTAAGLATTGLFFGYARQALLVMPFWLSLAAAGPVWLWGGRSFPERAPRRLVLGLAACALLVLVVEAMGLDADRNYRATGDTFDGRVINPDDTVRLEVLP